MSSNMTPPCRSGKAGWEDIDIQPRNTLNAARAMCQGCPIRYTECTDLLVTTLAKGQPPINALWAGIFYGDEGNPISYQWALDRASKNLRQMQQQAGDELHERRTAVDATRARRSCQPSVQQAISAGAA